MSELTPETVADRQFASGFLGYSRDEVRSFLRNVATTIADLESQKQDVEKRIGTLTGVDLESDIDRATSQINELLHQARSIAEDMRNRAAEESETLVSGARALANQEIAGASEDAYALRRDAWDTSSAMLQQCSAYAASLEESAQREAMQIVGEAEREAHRLQVSSRRESEDLARAARMEAERMTSEARARHDEILEAALKQSEAAQERTRALEQRRNELMVELDRLRARMSDDADSSTVRPAGPTPVPSSPASPAPEKPSPAAPTPRSKEPASKGPVKVEAPAGSTGLDSDHPDWVPGETVRVVHPSADPITVEVSTRLIDEPEIRLISAGELAERRTGDTGENTVVAAPLTDDELPPVAAAEPRLAIPQPAAPESALPEVPVSEVPVPEVPVPEVPVPEVPVSGVPVSGVPVSGVPVSGATAPEVGASEPASSKSVLPEPAPPLVPETPDVSPQSVEPEASDAATAVAEEEVDASPADGDPEGAVLNEVASLFDRLRHEGDEPPRSEVPRSEVPGSEVPRSEVSGSEVPGSEVPGSEAPGAEHEDRGQPADDGAASDVAEAEHDQGEEYESPIVGDEDDGGATRPDTPMRADAPMRIVDLDVFALRDRLLLPVSNRGLRSIKRHLVEEQNAALEELRLDAAGWGAPNDRLQERLEPELIQLATESLEAGHAAAEALVGESLADAALGPGSDSSGFVGAFVASLNETLADRRAAGEGDKQLGAAISKVFRVWRTDQAERRVRTLSLDLYHRGMVSAMSAAGHDSLAWRVAGRGCATCREHGAERVSSAVPPAHPDCQCTLAPLVAVR